MNGEKKIPVRKCSGCGEKREKDKLLRVVREANSGVIIVDYLGKAQGRGAYICYKKGCLAKAKKARRFERAFKCRIDEEIYDEIERVLDCSAG